MQPVQALPLEQNFAVLSKQQKVMAQNLQKVTMDSIQGPSIEPSHSQQATSQQHNETYELNQPNNIMSGD